VRSSSGCTQLSVETYGGGLWHTWFDRDLSVAGRVLVREGERIVQKLVKVDRPICRIPSLCIHLQTAEERAAFKFNKEDHLQPILAQEVKAALTGEKRSADSADGEDQWVAGHEPELMKLIANELKIETSQIADFELMLFDTQAAALGGVNEEFLYSARLDNQATCFVAAKAMADYDLKRLKDEVDVSMICMFDHEEVGSASQCGAGSPIMGEAVKRIVSAMNGGNANEDMLQVALRKSYCFSVDMAHAVHPNYASKHEKNHAPKMNAGVVIKTNSNQRYTTNSFTGLIIREVSRKTGAKVQEFVVRNDCPCGSTIGPIIAQRTGIRSSDAGMPQLSMHSCREVMGVADLTECLALFSGFYEHFRSLDEVCFFCT